MTTLFDTLHQLVDAARFHSEQQALDAHDSINAHQEGKSLEDYRKAKAAAAPAANPDAEDAILEKAKQIQAQRAAREEQQAQIAAKAEAQRPAPPVAVEGTPASSTAEPDATPTL
jgi:hypothetical protein